MFTGIVEHVGRIVGLSDSGSFRVLRIDIGPLARDAHEGASLSVDGVCLTVTGLAGASAEFDVSAETLRHTTLGERRNGDLVNLEGALRAGAQIGGHFVSGHVDDVGLIRHVRRLPGEVRLEVEAAPALTDMMIKKGSVAIDGISLTIAELSGERFEVALIPYTLEHTNLRDKGAGERVNIECDMIGRWVKRMVTQSAATSGLTMEGLERMGL